MRARRLAGPSAVEGGPGLHHVEPGVPRVVVALGQGGDRAELAVLALASAPVVDELVAGHADEPPGVDGDGAGTADGVDRGEEDLRGQLLGGRPVADAGDQVAVDHGQGPVVEVEEPCARRHRLRLHPGHVLLSSRPTELRRWILGFPAGHSPAP